MGPAEAISRRRLGPRIRGRMRGGVMLGSQAAFRAFGGKGGAIVNIASNAGKVGFPNMAAYNASKAAVINLTRSLAREWADRDINVNAVCPGSVATPMLREVADELAAKTGKGDAETLFAGMVPAQLGRHVTPAGSRPSRRLPAHRRRPHHPRPGDQRGRGRDALLTAGRLTGRFEPGQDGAVAGIAVHADVLQRRPSVDLGEIRLEDRVPLLEPGMLGEPGGNRLADLGEDRVLVDPGEPAVAARRPRRRPSPVRSSRRSRNRRDACGRR